MWIVSIVLAIGNSPHDLDERINHVEALARRWQHVKLLEQLDPQWMPNNEQLWFIDPSHPDGQHYVLVDARSASLRRARHLTELGLEAVRVKTSQTRFRKMTSRTGGAETSIEFVNELDRDVSLIWIDPDGREHSYGTLASQSTRRQATYVGHVWLIQEEHGAMLTIMTAVTSPMIVEIDGAGQLEENRDHNSREGRTSPDRRWRVFLDGQKIRIEDTVEHRNYELQEERPTSATRAFRGRIFWAPNSQRFVAWQSESLKPRQLTLIESWPNGNIHPSIRRIAYRKPGDPLPEPHPVLCEWTGELWRMVPVSRALSPQPFNENDDADVVWAPDSRTFYYDYNQRGHQLYRVLAVDCATGQVRTLVEERSHTFIDYRHKTWRWWLHDTGELLWMSERDGWCHLYLYHISDGSLQRQLTRGSWVVREVLWVDEQQRYVWFLASGVQAEEDPYHLHLFRVHLDTAHMEQFTEGRGTHRITFSPSKKYFVDSWSRVDHPPVHELRRSSDGRKVLELARCHWDELLSAGWSIPERVSAPGRDGKTEIYGVLVKPSRFDPQRKYPVLEEVYAGPHSAFAPVGFQRLIRQHMLAELGYVVVQSDGMGTNHRGKAFHDVCWKNLKDAGFPDRIAWMRAVAYDRPWMDWRRVGIYGGSAGGQSAMRALLDYSDVYQVAVADCGCHDNRVDKLWWNELWLGWPVDAAYERNSNVVDAHKLKGSLLLIVGEVDRNVDPACTWQVVAALQRAGKAFEVMPIMGAGHGAAETSYGSRLRMRFFLTHLPPD